MNEVVDFINVNRDRYVEELKQYLAIPSVSALPQHAADVRRAAEWTADALRAAGVPHARLVETPGNPVVYGEWMGAPGRPTVLFYGHYDVQPADPIELWRHPPFEPTEEGDCLVARGATDDKGQSFAHLKGIAAMLKERGALPVNVKLIIEGEEESGGEAIDQFVKEDRRRRLACDCVVVSDSSMYAPGQPALTYGLKGLVYCELKVTGPNHDLHSGTYGGGVTNPINALCEIIAKLRDNTTRKDLI